jgi:hypothetical protein
MMMFMCLWDDEYESMNWAMFWWVLKYNENEAWFMMRKWPNEMFKIYERDMCWKHDHESKCKMIL